MELLLAVLFKLPKTGLTICDRRRKRVGQREGRRGYRLPVITPNFLLTSSQGELVRVLRGNMAISDPEARDLTIIRPRRANAFHLASGMFHDPLQGNKTKGCQCKVPESSSFSAHR